MLNALVIGSLDRVSNTLHSLYHNRLKRLRRIKPKIAIYCEVGPFYVKTVTEREELIEALRLRYQVFHHEMAGKSRDTGLDIDEFDFQCDHIIIAEKKTKKVVGAFRLHSSQHSKLFYAARKFHLAALLDQQETMLELGRFCIHKDYRRGMASSLMWRGVAEYMVHSQAQFVFGCASFKTEDANQAALLFRYFQAQKKLDENCLVATYSCFRVPGFESALSKLSELTVAELAEAEAMIPFVCRGFLKSGSCIVSNPAWDAEFKCIDFLTILRREDLNRTLWK